jgi:hypothetical protein
MGNAILDWIKTHLTVVVCSTLGLVSVAMLILGVLDKDVSAKMTPDARLHQDLMRMRPPNETMIEEAKRELRKNRTLFEEAVRQLEKRSDRTPLLADAFPVMSSTARFDFGGAYEKKQRQLLGLLRALDRPSNEEIEKEQKYLDTAEDLAETERGLGSGGRQRTVGRGFGRPPSGPQGPRGGEGETLSERCETDAELRVSIRRAREIYCYGTPDSLDNRGKPSENEPPTQDFMWYAQMSLWLQEDVIRALAQLNENTAAAIQENGGEPWVGNLPVKHLRQIAVGDYVPQAAMGGMQAAGQAPGGQKDLMPPGTGSMVFTGQGSTADVDVIQFGIDLVVEEAKLPAVIDAICGAGFYTPLLVNYEAVEPNLEMMGYIYGNDPVVNVQLQFEGCFMRSEFDKLMPESVKTAIQNGEAGIRGGRSGGGGRPSPRGRPGGGRQRYQGRDGAPIAS